ncbi:hypothetical protein [Streptomyces sp. H27-D2]|uniref:hypothetical protein n=1 Tax=Streptomyces sp. H27-D2 TaxID=3046304 RepID=UPI002DB98F8F|nr:hypothetical protein [Streptomyces sp. H27-D2]MEC4015855.1 hypothetical protein [Streptomyces sp. H27-D2]
MPHTPEEPQIHESVPGPRVTPAVGRTAQTPRPVPGPRPAAPRPAPPRGAPATGARPGSPGPNRGPAAPQRAHPEPVTAAPATRIQLVPASFDGALEAADGAVDLLLDAGRAPKEILVLTTGDQHPWAVHELSFGEASYWAQHDAADDVFYADAAAERPVGRPVVVLVVNGGSDEVVGRAVTAASGLAGALLIACGDPERINPLVTASV